MSISWQVGFILPLSLCAAVLSMTGLDLVIMSDPENSEKTPRALLTTVYGIPFSHMPKYAFTFCFYVKLEYRAWLSTTLVSYSSQEAYEYNEVYFEVAYGENYTALSIHDGSAAIFNKIPPHKQWTHVCTSWNSHSGKVRLFMDGQEAESVDPNTVVHKGKTIGGDGYLILGQDQDYYNGGYDAWQGIKGKLTQFNVWPRVLSTREVNHVKNCWRKRGETVRWSTSSWELTDGVTVKPSTAPCSVSCGEGSGPNGETGIPREHLIQKPKEQPTQKPTQQPTQKPTEQPTQKPTEQPTQKPTEQPTQKPTEQPTQKPTEQPTQKPTKQPTKKLENGAKVPKEKGWVQNRKPDGKGGWIKEYVWQGGADKPKPVKDDFVKRKSPDGKGGWIVEYVFKG